MERPWSSFDLVSDIIPRYSDTHNAISAFAVHKIDDNLSLETFDGNLEGGNTFPKKKVSF